MTAARTGPPGEVPAPTTEAGTNRSSRVMSNDLPNPRWPDAVALVPNPIKNFVVRALKSGVDNAEIAEATGLDIEQVAAIRAAVAR